MPSTKNAYEIGYEAGVINFTPNPRVFIPRATAQDCAEFARGWHAGHAEIEVDRRVAAIEAFFNAYA